MIKLQKILFYFCWLIIAVSLAQFIPNFTFPKWLSSYALPILLTGATGFLTNYIAIEMLFKPYDITTTKFSNIGHLSFWREGGALRILTLGFWRIGLVPANKDRIGVKLGEEIPARLLNEDKLAEHICDELTMLPQKNPEILLKIRDKIFDILQESPQLIISGIHPILTAQITQFLHNTFTSKQLQDVIENLSGSWLSDQKNRDSLCKIIQQKAEEQIPEIRSMLKDTAQIGIHDFINEKASFLAMMGNSMVDSAIENYDWTKIDKLIYDKIYSEHTSEMLSDYLGTLPTEIHQWCVSETGQQQLQVVTKKLHVALISELYKHLTDFISKTIFSFLSSDQIILWTEKKLIPALHGHFVQWFKEEGKTLLIRTLDLSNRIESAVAKQDMRTFHQMINGLVERHLGTIQILGFFIGLVIGIIQIF